MAPSPSPSRPRSPSLSPSPSPSPSAFAAGAREREAQARALAKEAGVSMRAIWLDCDPGHDDMMAIFLAGHTPGAHLLGVSTVAGNQGLDRVTQNALVALTMAGLTHVPVVRGQGAPLLGAHRPCAEIHGESGLESAGRSGQELPRPAMAASPGNAVMQMAQRIEAYFARTGERVHLVATGGLTNVALLLTLFPEVGERYLEQIVFMGGALGLGNTGPVAEFNIQHDPHAAHIVVHAGVPVVMVPLEVTHTALVTASVLGRIDAMGTGFGSMVHDLLLYFQETYKRVFRFPSPPLHDPCAVAYVLEPDIFATEFLNVEVELGSSLSAGQTVVDLFGQTGRPPNVRVALKMDVAEFWELMLSALDRANVVSPMTTMARETIGFSPSDPRAGPRAPPPEAYNAKSYYSDGSPATLHGGAPRGAPRGASSASLSYGESVVDRATSSSSAAVAAARRAGTGPRSSTTAPRGGAVQRATVVPRSPAVPRAPVVPRARLGSATALAKGVKSAKVPSRLTPSAKAHAKADETARRAGDLLDRLTVEGAEDGHGEWGDSA